MKENILLICTVGGSPEPLAASILRWRPQRIIFLPSPDTVSQIETSILPMARQEGFSVSPGNYETRHMTDPQDFQECVRAAQELKGEVYRWLSRGEEYGLVVDFTGGTKCMTAALALQAHRWPCVYSYVGGEERTKDGVGVVVSGKEKIAHTANPWDSLGYQVIEEAVILFNQGAYSAVSIVLEPALRNLGDPLVKRELATMKSLAEAYAAWDRFDHRAASDNLKNVLRHWNDMAKLFPEAKNSLFSLIQRHLDYLDQIISAKAPSLALICDLLANARRRATEKRYDDAVARLYRATEALAQLRLREAYGIQETGNVSLKELPSGLAERWDTKAKDGVVKLGLQDSYFLLKELGDDLAAKFESLGWDESSATAPLFSRNHSILAHGFKPVGKRVFDQLWQGCFLLAGLKEEDLVQFPRLTEAP